MKWLHQCFGLSKQGFHKRMAGYKKRVARHQVLLKLVEDQRKEISQGMGGYKLHFTLKQKMEAKGIKIGRDKFYDFLREHRLLVPKHKRFHITTNSKHGFYKYPNLVSGKVPTRAEQLWVSDITYIRTQSGFTYLALVTDAYSRQIMGYKLATHMRASLCKEALDMAIKNRKYPSKTLIHHSDRGLQYCAPEYVDFAEKNNLTMSMTQQYDPYENALAERINRTLKYEFGLKETIASYALAMKMVNRGVDVYNRKRPHRSLNMLTPSEVHLKNNMEYKTYRRDKYNVEKLLI